MKILSDENLDVVSKSQAMDHFLKCKSSSDVDCVAINSCLGIYCSPKQTRMLFELLIERSQTLKILKDEKATIYVIEKLFKDFNFYQPFNVLANFSSEAFDAIQMNDLKTARLYLKKLMDGVQEYGMKLHKEQLEEFEQRIGNILIIIEDFGALVA